MMCFLLIILVSLLCVEVVYQLPWQQQIRRVFEGYQKMFSVMGSKRISEHWKAVVIPRYATLTVKRIFALVMNFVLIGLTAGAPLVLLHPLACGKGSVWETLLRVDVLFLSIATCIGYAMVRKYALVKKGT